MKREKKFNQSAYVRDYIKEKRAKITILCLPQQKENWKAAAQKEGKSLNRYIIDKIDNG